MIISHVKIIAFQLSLFCKNYRFSKTVLYIINRKIHGWLEIPDLFLVLNMTSHLFAALTCEISCSTVEINLVFPRTHVLFNKYKTFSVLIYSYINTSGIGKTRNCMETRRPKGGVFSYNFEFSQLPRVLI